MALFGLGYGKKDYDKNTRIFLDRLNGFSRENYESGLGTGALIEQAMLELERYPFKEGKNTKEQKAVDERIAQLLQTMEDDIQGASPALFAAHAQMLFSAIKESRKFGKERFTPQQIHAQEQLAKVKAEIYDTLDRKQRIIQQKEKLLKDAAKTKNEAELAKIRMNFNELDKQEKTCDKQVTMFQSRHNQFVDVINQGEVSDSVDRLDDMSIVSLADYTKQVAETSMKIAKNAELDDSFADVTKDADAAFGDAYANQNTESSFDQLLESKKSEMAASAISGAAYSPAAKQEENDAFAAAMGKLNL